MQPLLCHLLLTCSSMVLLLNLSDPCPLVVTAGALACNNIFMSAMNCCEYIKAGYLQVMAQALAVQAQQVCWMQQELLLCMSPGLRRSRLVSWVEPLAAPEKPSHMLLLPGACAAYTITYWAQLPLRNSSHATLSPAAHCRIKLGNGVMHSLCAEIIDIPGTWADLCPRPWRCRSWLLARASAAAAGARLASLARLLPLAVQTSVAAAGRPA